MKKTIRCLLIVLPVLLLLIAGCKREEIPLTARYSDAVYFVHENYDENIDSLNFSFVSMPDSVTTDTVWLPVRVAGNMSQTDRAIGLAPVDTATTAVQGTHYKLLSYTMPKDSFSTSLGVVLYRTPDLQDTAMTLTLQIMPGQDFPVLMKDTVAADGRMYSRSRYKIIFSDQLIKPGDWDSFLVYLFGTYSKVKYRFIIDVTGRTDFPISGAGALNYGQLLYYQGVIQTSLSDYNTAHGTMYDEHGNPVTIP